ncbi:tRNA (guanine(26)-N(2))-dimethyltransferase [Desulfurococcus amylolyticus]|uniref:tRNA (guanine(26)-N(2))-dimethyltransferase n=1 Tax=Desulfurococcus amylolyticus DSM 16532 TaxID=768672 RepID=I3XSF3_DESAM|nr:tRNA (guanine(26)-N(2))-dimethyltransferase [Desulfurococcus amylolyticus]AFL66877.1 N(2),N(2)-dimethylguanosine tRNA methyltransferase [Desulfurococcus amylolyticus DSM 16532]
MNEVKILSREQLIQEGLAKLVIPRMDEYRRPDGSIEPAWMPVFYNPQAIVSRDVTVSVLRTLYGSRNIFFVDPLAGTGIRSIRIALEKGGEGIVNDIDPHALYYIRKNLQLNNLHPGKLHVYSQEANILLNNLTFTGISFDYIDLDPYGSPVPFVDSVFKPLGKRALIGVTATDTAPLTCSHYRKTLRRYWFTCVHTDFEKEMGARLLIAYIVKRASALDIAARPLLTFIYKHYYRVFFETLRSTGEAYRLINECLGYIWYCSSTLERGYIKSLDEARDLTCINNEKPVLTGETWICSLGEAEFIDKVFNEADKISWLHKDSKRILGLLRYETRLNNPYVRIDKLCSIIGRNMPKYEILIEALKQHGIIASRTHFDPRGLKIDSDVKALTEVLKSI